jgi:hypothetical protein
VIPFVGGQLLDVDAVGIALQQHRHAVPESSHRFGGRDTGIEHQRRGSADARPSAVIESLRAMTAIGFEEEVKPDDDYGDDMLFVRWIDTMTYKDEFTGEFSDDSATETAVYADIG